MMKMQMLKRGGMTSRVTQEDILDGFIPSTLMSGLKRENCHKKRFNINYQLYDGKHVLLSTLYGFVLDTVSMSIMNHRISKVDSCYQLLLQRQCQEKQLWWELYQVQTLFCWVEVL